MLFDLSKCDRAFIQARDNWHYDQHVYGEQVAGRVLDVEHLNKYQRLSLDYVSVMRETIFCLCPSGSGPNSIRLWEALGFGCIPVILSDTLSLPGDQELWRLGAVFISEKKSSVLNLPEFLASLDPSDFVNATEELWRRYGLNGFTYDINQLSPEVGL